MMEDKNKVPKNKIFISEREGHTCIYIWLQLLIIYYSLPSLKNYNNASKMLFITTPLINKTAPIGPKETEKK